MKKLYGRATKRALLLLILSLLATLPGSFSREFSTRGEAREALVAQSMISTGAWILPEGYGGAVPSKPPMTHWLMSLTALPFGEMQEGNARLPMVLLGALTVVVFFLFLIRMNVFEEHAFLASLILATSFEWVRAASTARVDMILTTFFVTGLLALYRWEERECKSFPLGAILLLSGATLAKGPVSIVLPGGIFGLYLLVRRYSLVRAILLSLRVWFPVLCLGLIWYLLAYFERGESFLQKVWYENFQRFAGTMEDEPHRHTVFYLFGMLLVGLLPWSIVLFAKVKAIFPCKRDSFKQVYTFLMQWWHSTTNTTRYFVIIALVTTIFFSLPSSKRGVYLLPAYPAYAYLLSAWILSFRKEAARVTSVVTATLSVIVILLSTLCTLVLSEVVPPALFISSERARALLKSIQESMTPLLVVFSLLPVVGSIGYLLLRKKISESCAPFTVLAFLLALVASAYNGGLGVAVTKTTSPKQMADYLRINLPAESHLLSFGYEFYALSFYLERRIDRLEEGSAGEGDYIFILDKDADTLRKQFSFREVARSSVGAMKKGAELVVVEVSGVTK